MVPMVRELGLVPTFTDLNFPRVHTQFDADGNLLDAAYESRIKAFDQLVWMAKCLRWGRENLSSEIPPVGYSKARQVNCYGLQ